MRTSRGVLHRGPDVFRPSPPAPAAVNLPKVIRRERERELETETDRERERDGGPMFLDAALLRLPLSSNLMFTLNRASVGEIDGASQ